MQKKAFTLIELVFVIVVTAILSMVAYSQWGDIVSSGYHVQTKATLASLRTALSIDRQRLSMQGENPYRQTLDSAAIGAVGSGIFEGNSTHPLLEGVKQSNEIGGWMKKSENSYDCKVSSSQSVTFIYDHTNGRIECRGEGCVLLE